MRRSSFLLMVLLVLNMQGQVQAQADATDTSSPPDLQFEPPTVFNSWCDQMNDKYSGTCECNTERSTKNNVQALDLEHTIRCEILTGENMTCVDGVTIESAIVELDAMSVGEEGNYTHVNHTQITRFYIRLETDIRLVEFKYNNVNLRQRTNNCDTVWGGYECTRCGICQMPEVGVQVSPNDIFNGISGECRNFGEGPRIGEYNVCDNGDNPMTRVLFQNLSVAEGEDFGACPGYRPTFTLPPTPSPDDSAAPKNFLPGILLASMASMAAYLAL